MFIEVLAVYDSRSVSYACLVNRTYKTLVILGYVILTCRVSLDNQRGFQEAISCVVQEIDNQNAVFWLSINNH